MELLAKAEELLLALKTRYEELVEVEKALATSAGYDVDKEALFQQEFSLLLDMTAIYDDLLKALDVLEQEEGMRFVVRRLRQESEPYVSIDILYSSEGDDYE